MNTPANKPLLVRDIPRTVDFRLSANVFQASAVLVLSIVGAIVGYGMVQQRQWLAAAAGAVVGMISATFISGFILMFIPQRTPMLLLEDSVQKYKRLWTRFNIAGICYLIWSALIISWLTFHLPVTDGLGLVTASVWGVIYATLQYHGYVLDLWNCPSCGTRFGRKKLFHKFSHHCISCDFAISKLR